jgi:hypothetical protein
MVKRTTLEEQLLAAKPKIRAAHAARKRVVTIGDTKFSILAKKVRNVTYLTVKPSKPELSTPIINFPFDENEYRREMESRGKQLEL